MQEEQCCSEEEEEEDQWLSEGNGARREEDFCPNRNDWLIPIGTGGTSSIYTIAMNLIRIVFINT